MGSTICLFSAVFSPNTFTAGLLLNDPLLHFSLVLTKLLIASRLKLLFSGQRSISELDFFSALFSFLSVDLSNVGNFGNVLQNCWSLENILFQLMPTYKVSALDQQSLHLLIYLYKSKSRCSHSMSFQLYT